MQKPHLSPFEYKEIHDHVKLDSYFEHATTAHNIKKVAVIGSGVMGSGIAALLANSSVEVVLLDIASDDSNNKNSVVEQALEKLETQKPAPLTSECRKDFIKIGNLDDDLKLLRDCDLIIEVIVEKLAIKWQLYDKIIPHLKEGVILASNTSTLPLKQLKKNLPESLKSRFLIIHFFNPPRYMELVELVSSKETDLRVLDDIKDFVNNKLGKTIVECNDTPGFIANRVGCFFIELVVRKGIAEELDPVIIDNILTKLFKLPSTGIFGLYDLIGHDVLKLISDSLINNLPDNDIYKQIYLPTPLLDRMVTSSYIGRKGKGGFYQISEIAGKKGKKVVSFARSSITDSEGWHPTYIKIKDIKHDDEQFNSIEELFNSPTPYGIFFKDVLFKFYYYLFSLIPSVTNKPLDIDLAMKLGYSWKIGPFELLEYIPGGINWVIKQIAQQSLELPKSLSTDALKQIENLKSSQGQGNHIFDAEILSNVSSKLCLYKNKLVLSFESKMNCLNNEIFELFLESISYAEKHEKTLFIYSPESPHFSAGADLKFIIECTEAKDFDKINSFVSLGQQVTSRMQNSRINIIACARGVALGGGCELLLHSDFIVAHSELKSGLVEMSVGLIPGWGGIKEMFVRSQGNAKLLIKNLQNIILQNKSGSADQFANDYVAGNYKIVMNKDHLLDEAIKLKLPQKILPFLSKIILPEIELSTYFAHVKLDEFQNEMIASFQEIINLKTVSTKELLEFEKKTFLMLYKRPETHAKLKENFG
jgi:3-hydroxyacyl-CoA dehydrogenase/enoyl-CoA hydratase/3-hydroxybutyryl-CoA epimerase